jgi:hypothetical protein
MRTGCSGARIAGSTASSSNRRSVATRRALQIADHFADGAHGAGDDRAIEHEGRQLAALKLAATTSCPPIHRG